MRGPNEETSERSPALGGDSAEFTKYLRKDLRGATKASFNPYAGARNAQTRLVSLDFYSQGARR